MRRFVRWTTSILIIVLLLWSGCVPGSRRTTGGSGTTAAPLAISEGDASYYADRFEGRPTASGEIFHQNELTAAHRDYPFGTVVRVVHLANGLDVTVRINDRGPSKRSRIIDLSRSAAERIKLIAPGVSKVRLEVIRWGS